MSNTKAQSQLAKRYGKHLDLRIQVGRYLANLDLRESDNAWAYLMNEGVAMREHGLTWDRIKKALEEKLELMGQRAY